MNLDKFKAELLSRARDMRQFLESDGFRGDIVHESASSALDAASAEMSMRQYAAMVEACGGQQALMDWLEEQLHADS